MEIDHHIGAAMSGLVADGITLIDNARVNAANHYFNYGEPISVVCLLLLLCTGFQLFADMIELDG